MNLVFWLIFANIDQTAKAGGSLIISITSICLKSGHTPCLGNVNICYMSHRARGRVHTWTGRQSVTGLRQRHRQPFTPMAPINVIAKGEQDVRRPF